MGVSILMTPGPVGRNHGKQVDITPGGRSKAAGVLQANYGEAPFTLYRDDLTLLQAFADGASVYVFEKDNFWAKIIRAINVHEAVTIVMEW